MMPTPKPKPINLILILFLFTASITRAQGTLRFECPIPPDKEHFKQLEEIHRQIFEPLNYRIEFVPSKIRSGGFQQLINGELDGSCGRANNTFSSVAEYHEQVVSLTTPLFNYSVVVLSPEKLPHNQLLQARLGVTPGTKAFHLKLKAMGLDLVEFQNETELLAAMESRKVDGIIAYNTLLNFTSPQQRQLQRQHSQHLILSSIKLALHRKHKELIPLAQDSLDSWYQKNKKQLLKDAQRQAEKAQNYFEKSTTPNRRKITFSCGTKKWDPAFNLALQLLGRAFDTLGFDFAMIPTPKSREQAMLASGQVDGSCGLTSATNQVSGTKMIPVNFLLLTHHVDLWSSRLQPMLRDYDSIPAGASVAFTRSLMVLEYIIDSLPWVTPMGSHNVEQMIRLTAAGRSDYGLGVDEFIHNYKEFNMTQNDMYRIMRSGPYNFYAYLTPDNRELAAPLSQALTDSPPDLLDLDPVTKK